MPDLFDDWGVERSVSQNSFGSNDPSWIMRFRTDENTQNVATIKSSRQHLYRLMLKHQHHNLGVLLTNALAYLEKCIKINYYDKLPELTSYFVKAVVPNSYATTDILYFHPIHAARRALKFLDLTVEQFSGFLDEAYEKEFALAILVYWAEALDTSTYSPWYIRGSLVLVAADDPLICEQMLQIYNILVDQPHDCAKHLEYASLLLKTGYYLEAIEEFNEVIALNEFLSDAYRGRAIAHSELGNLGLAEADFKREHSELKKQAYVLALYEGRRGNNFNTYSINTFARENFKLDNYVCNNGEINKLAEYFAPFAQVTQTNENLHVTLSIEDELYKAMATQLCLSYQRVHMERGQIKLGAPSLLDYCELLQQYYVRRKGLASWASEATLYAANIPLAEELKIIFRNIHDIFHGVVFQDSNPQGLLNYQAIALLDTVAQVLSDLPEIVVIEDLTSIDAKLRAIKNLASREFNFSVNAPALSQPIIDQIREFMLSKIYLEVFNDIERFNLSRSKAFDYVESNLLNEAVARQTIEFDALHQQFFSRIDTLTNYNHQHNNRPRRNNSNLANMRILLDSSVVWDDDDSDNQPAVANTSNSAAGLVIDNRTSVVGFAMDNRTSLVGFAIDNRTSLVGFAIDNRTSLIGTLTINPARSGSAEANNASPAPARRRRQNRAGS